MIDIRTLIFTLSLGFFVVAVMGAYMARLHREEPAIGYWAAGAFAIGAGDLLLFLRPVLPSFLGIVAANMAIIIGGFLIYAGIAIFDRRPTLLKIFMAGSVIVAGLLTYWTYVTPNYFNRLALITAALLPMLVLMAAALLDPAGREHVAMRRVLGALFIYLAVLSVWRIADALLMPHPDRGGLFVNSRMQALWYLSMLLVTFLACFDFLLMPGQRIQRRLDSLARSDDLTGLLNRRGFNESMQAHTASVPGTNGEQHLLVLDLDHFKRLNDVHRHAAGDAVLREFAATATSQLRDDDIFARYGGEEFSVLLPRTSAAEAFAVAERIRKAVEAMEVRFRDAVLHTTVSIGIAPLEGTDAEAALVRADTALYRAKSLGRNRTEACTRISANTSAG